MSLTKSETSLLHKLDSFWHEAYEAHADKMQIMAENYGFVTGDEQWDASVKSYLLANDRPALTINLLLPIVNLLVGTESNNKQDIIVYPKKGGMRIVAEILTALAKHTTDVSEADFEQTLQFIDGIIAGKGWCAVDISYDEDIINGELVISRVSPFNMFEDPNNNKYDIQKCKYITRLYWADKDKIIALYPKYKRELEDLLDSATGEDVIDYHNKPITKENNDCDPSLRRFRLKETWWTEWEERKFIVNKETMDFIPVHKKKEDLLTPLMTRERRLAEKENRPVRYHIIEQPTKVLRMATFFQDRIVLENVTDPFNGVMSYPFSRYVPYWMDGRMFGIIDNLKDIQRDYNKRRSQILHIINQTANSGWIIEENSGVDETELEEMGSKPGIVVKYRGIPPQKIQPNDIPQAHLLTSQIDKQDLQDVSGISANLQGQKESANESGIAIYRRQQQGMVISQALFNNFNRTLRSFGRVLIDFIRNTDVFSIQEIASIIDMEKKQISPMQLIQAIKSFRVGHYGLKVSTRPTAITLRQAQFDELLAITQAGMPVPIDVLLEYTDIASKEEIIARVRAQQEQQQQIAMLELQARLSGNKAGSPPAPKGTPSPPKASVASQRG